MIPIVDTVAMYAGYLVLGGLGMVVALKVGLRLTYETAVSEEAKQQARDLDPNHPVGEAAQGVINELVLREARKINSDEQIRAKPQPIAHLDWSTDDAEREQIAELLTHASNAGYHVHPFPDTREYAEHDEWTGKVVGVWESEPEWYVAEFNDGRWQNKEPISVEPAKDWQIQT